ncbi:peptidase S8/S53 domain-containing protein, partial [Leptodontidium sp. 2 PMI_412]
NLRRTRAVVEQANAVPELKRFSQVPGTEFDSMTGYSYDSSSGTGITVYVIDTGFGTDSDEYKNMGGEPPRWLFAASEKADASESDEDENSHGSCAGSKVNGPTYGVVKNANLVIVKAQETLGDTVSAMNEVLADIVKNKLNGKAVINMSRGGKFPKIITFMEKWTAATVKLDVILVLSAGNDEKAGIEINEFPQLLADEYPIINVGAVDETGKNATFSKGGPLVTVMAPGVNIICASGDPSGADQDIDGTSFAAPAVAGLAAYLLALGDYPDLAVTGSVAANMRDIITSMAYPRITDGGPVAYNGEGA